jgi:hypothetical protein
MKLHWIIEKCDLKLKFFCFNNDFFTKFSGKSGHCPMARAVTKCINRCNSDFECSFDKKCCLNVCGTTSCADSESFAHGTDLRDLRDGRKCVAFSHNTCSFYFRQGDKATYVTCFLFLVNLFTSKYSTGQWYKTNKYWQRRALFSGITRVPGSKPLNHEHNKK